MDLTLERTLSRLEDLPKKEVVIKEVKEVQVADWCYRLDRFGCQRRSIPSILIACQIPAIAEQVKERGN